MSIIDKLKLNKYTNMVVINEPSDYEVLQEKKLFSKEHDAILFL